MRLNNDQKELVLQWIAEGLKPGEMNKRATQEDPPFKVNREQVHYYRKSRKMVLEDIVYEQEFQALNTGLARREERVNVLKKLAELLIKDLMEKGLLWTEVPKTIAKAREIVKEFNKAEVDTLRGVLDDIAKELGHRIAKSEISTEPTGEIKVTFHNPYHDGKEDG